MADLLDQSGIREMSVKLRHETLAQLEEAQPQNLLWQRREYYITGGEVKSEKLATEKVSLFLPLV